MNDKEWKLVCISATLPWFISPLGTLNLFVFAMIYRYICIYIPMYISPDMLGQECLATDCLSILNFLGLSVCFFFLFFTRPAALFSSWVGSLLQFHEFFPVRFSQNFQLSSCVSVCTLCYRIKLLLPTTIIQTLCWQLCTYTNKRWLNSEQFIYGTNYV